MLLRDTRAYHEGAVSEQLRFREAVLAVSLSPVAASWQRLTVAFRVLLVVMVLHSRLYVLHSPVALVFVPFPIRFQLVLGDSSIMDVRTLVFPDKVRDVPEVPVALERRSLLLDFVCLRLPLLDVRVLLAVNPRNVLAQLFAR